MKLFPSLLALCLVTASVLAQSASPPPAPTHPEGFGPGEPALALQVQEWIKGTPITQLEKGKVYLVEFWATWCGPCVGGIPHLNALQRKYAKDGLVVIGFTAPDVEPGYTGPRKENNPLQKVRDFVAGRGDGMAYHVAYDTPDKATYKSWMNRVRGIPHSFLIGRDGRLVVAIHPFFMDDVIAQTIAGTWDPVAGPQRLNAGRELHFALYGMVTPEQFWPKYDELERIAPLLAQQEAGLKLPFALRRGNAADIEATVATLIAIAREHNEADKLAERVVSLLRPVEAFQIKEIPATATAEERKRREEQNQLGQARAIEAKLVPPLPLALADRMARTAFEINARESAALSAMAEVAYARGDRTEAVKFQRLAVSATSKDEQERENQRLAEFERTASQP